MKRFVLMFLFDPNSGLRFPRKVLFSADDLNNVENPWSHLE